MGAGGSWWFGRNRAQIVVMYLVVSGWGCEGHVWKRRNSAITLWWTNILPWKITMFNGKIHYKWPFSTAMLVHQRVRLQERTSISIEFVTPGHVFPIFLIFPVAHYWYNGGQILCTAAVDSQRFFLHVLSKWICHTVIRSHGFVWKCWVNMPNEISNFS